jgi:methyl-accepting chemotaxis protein WspA
MGQLSQLSIKAKLYGLVTISVLGVLLVLVLAGVLLARFRVNGSLYEQLVASKEAMSDLRPASLLLDREYLYLGHMRTASPEGRARLRERCRVLEEEYNTHYQQWTEQLPDGALRRGLQDECHPIALEFLGVANNEYLPAIFAQNDTEAANRIFLTRLRPLFDKQERAVEGIVQRANKEIKETEDRAREQIRFWMLMMTIIGIATVASVGLLGGVLSRGVVRSTRILNRRVQEMASGASDLTARVAVQTHDEMGQLALGINATIAKIHAIVQRVREASVQLLSTAAEIAATARQQESHVQQMGSSTAEIASAVRQISATGKELSGTMNEVNDRANETSNLATKGLGHLEGLQQTGGRLEQATASISSKLATIREKADAINGVVATITKVADQTNLLSINAAIEAEKAGEYGRGFLVVAREIRRLADQTAVATLDIETMVRQMQDAVSAGVMQMDKFTEEMRSASSRVREVSEQMGQIIEEVRGLSGHFHEVNEGMRNQAAGAQQINEAMGLMSDSCRQTIAALDEFRKATAHLRTSVELINQEIAQFTV